MLDYITAVATKVMRAARSARFAIPLAAASLFPVYVRAEPDNKVAEEETKKEEVNKEDEDKRTDKRVIEELHDQNAELRKEQLTGKSASDDTTGKSYIPEAGFHEGPGNSKRDILSLDVRKEFLISGFTGSLEALITLSDNVKFAGRLNKWSLKTTEGDADATRSGYDGIFELKGPTDLFINGAQETGNLSYDFSTSETLTGGSPDDPLIQSTSQSNDTESTLTHYAGRFRQRIAFEGKERLAFELTGYLTNVRELLEVKDHTAVDGTARVSTGSGYVDVPVHTSVDTKVGVKTKQVSVGGTAGLEILLAEKFAINSKVSYDRTQTKVKDDTSTLSDETRASVEVKVGTRFDLFGSPATITVGRMLLRNDDRDDYFTGTAAYLINFKNAIAIPRAFLDQNGKWGGSVQLNFSPREAYTDDEANELMLRDTTYEASWTDRTLTPRQRDDFNRETLGRMPLDVKGTGMMFRVEKHGDHYFYRVRFESDIESLFGEVIPGLSAASEVGGGRSEREFAAQLNYDLEKIGLWGRIGVYGGYNSDKDADTSTRYAGFKIEIPLEKAHDKK